MTDKNEYALHNEININNNLSDIKQLVYASDMIFAMNKIKILIFKRNGSIFRY